MKWTVLSAAGVCAVALVLAPTAAADPGMPPCDGLLATVCGMVPIMPELDHDIDLTKQYPSGGGLDQEHIQPPDVCSLACI
jgi:hypothetical protein